MATKTGSDKKVKGASSMEELMKSQGKTVRGFKRGEKVSGKVIEVTKRTVLVDVGGKAEAMVSEMEFEIAKDYFKTLKPGDTVEGMVLVTENDSGQVILSLRKAAIDTRWTALEQAMTDEKDIAVRVKETTKGGVLVDLDGVLGFIPVSQMSRELEANPGMSVGKTLMVKVMEIDRLVNKLVLSEKAVTDAGEIEKQKQALTAIKIGEEYPATVVGVVPFGVFAEIETEAKPKKKGESGSIKFEGLIHISELSWEKIDDVSKEMKVGTKLKVQVIGVDEETGKLALSVKRLTDDPWLVITKKYKTDTKHEGTVTKIAPYGVLVRMEKGIEGLIHASKMPAEQSFVEGQKIEVFVESVDLDKRRLSLGVVLSSKPVGYK